MTSLRQAPEQTRQALVHSQRQSTVLRQKLDALARRFFGEKGEQLNAAQLEPLLSGLAESVIFEEKEEPPARLAPPRSCVPSQRIRTPDYLEVARQIIEPELVLAQPEQWKRIGEEVRRRLDCQPGQFFWRETIRPKYVRLGWRELPPVIAPAPAQVADHSLAAPGLPAQILVVKHCGRPPCHRQEQIFRQRHGVFISRQQTAQRTGQSVRLLCAISDYLKRQIRQSGYAQADETPVRHQDPDLPGRCGQGCLWTASVPGQGVVYEWRASRADRCLGSLLGPGCHVKPQCDGYSACPAFVKNKEVELFGCWAHARRGFFQAQEQAPKIAGWFLNQIGAMHGWEKQLRQGRAGPALRQAHRHAHSRMVMERLQRALMLLRPRYLPQSPMSQAISHTFNQWASLQRFLDQGEVETDNNLVENAIRPTAIGKKNRLFFGSEEAGRRSAVIHTLIENCRRHGVEPDTHLKDALERLPGATNREVGQLTPLHRKKARQAQFKRAA